MLVIFEVLLMFTGAAIGSLMIPVCRYNLSDLCYGAVGHTLYLQLPSEDILKLKKNISGNTTVQILSFKKQQITQKHSDPRWQFVADNRTMIISSAEKTDSGRYIIDTFDSNGTNKGRYYLQLVIEGVVSSVKVTYSCLSSEKRSVTCSSDGDHVQYSWTVFGRPQTDKLVDENQTLLLDKEAVGRVTCDAQNHVSREHNTTELPPCAGTTTVTPSTILTPKVTEWTPSVNGTTLRVTDKELQTPTHNSISNPFTSQHLVFVSVWVVEMIILMSLLGGFHIYYRIQRKKINRAAETKEEEVEEAL